ncbi:integrin alpha-PS4-like isoform X2 [Artemia franciscana]|uniref:integrin alpha-PS4-like isoform X2 n=1 Tax=Artemia franciscana TaxID=6661 RepID=UPI0032DA7159
MVSCLFHESNYALNSDRLKRSNAIREIEASGLLQALSGIFCYNVDVKYPIFIASPKEINSDSHFGQAVKFARLSKSQSSWYVLSGAPKASSEFWKEFESPGQMYKCLIDEENINGGCQPFNIAKSRNLKIRNDHIRYYNNSVNLQVDEYQDMLFGSTVELSDDGSGLLMACGYRYSVQVNNVPILGTCFSGTTDDTVDDTFSMVDFGPEHFNFVKHDRKYTGSVDFYGTGYAQMGISSHILKKERDSESSDVEAILGAPGIDNWSGGLVKATFIQGKSPSVKILGKGSGTSYLGYSVVSGNFRQPGETLYVVGAPRSEQAIGKILFVKEGGFRPIPRKYYKEISPVFSLKGERVGHYYGATLLAVDLDNDGLDELLVGAPLYSIASRGSSYDEGKVYVYSYRLGSMESVNRGLYTGISKGLFGMSMSNLGDINNDGYNDVAIGAPYEDDSGAVYIFHGSETEVISPFPVQHIRASQFHLFISSLSGFGISINSADIDGNRYNDIVVGAFQSGHVVVLRSKPIISVKMRLVAEPPTFGVSFTSSINNFQLTACIQYSMPNGAKPQDVCANTVITSDIPPPSQPRVRLIEGNIPREGRIHKSYGQKLVENQWVCKEFTVQLTDEVVTSRNIGTEPLKFEFQAEIGSLSNQTCIPFLDSSPADKSNEKFCKTCPMLKPGDSLVEQLRVPVVKGCGKDGVCLSDLSIEGRILEPSPEEPSIILGQHEVAVAVIIVTNNGPHDSSSNIVIIDWDGKSDIGIARSGCTLVPDIRRPQLQCDLRQVLTAGEKEEIIVYFDIRNTYSSQFEMDAEVMSQSIDTLKENNKVSVSRVLESRSTFDVIGVTKYVQDASLYDKSVPEYFLRFWQKFQVKKSGPSPIKSVDVIVNVPRIFQDKDSNVALAIKVQSNEGVCRYDKSSHFFTQKPGVTEPGDIGTAGTEEISIDYGGYEPEQEREGATLTRKKRDTSDDYNYQIPTSAFKLDCSEGSKALCDQYICTFKDIYGEQIYFIDLEGIFRPFYIRKALEKHDFVLIKSFAKLSENSTVESDSNSDFCASVLQSKLQALPLWVWPVAIIGGILLLLLITYLLYKVGFFKRKKIPNADKEKLNEERENSPSDENPK